MGRLQFHPLVVLICCMATSINAQGRSYEIRIDKFRFRAEDQKLIPSHSSWVEQDVNRSYISGHLLLSHDLEELKMNAKLDVQRLRMPRLRLFDVRLDLCAALREGYKNKFLRTFITNYIAFVNVQARCPLKANFNYTLTRAYVDAQVLPDFLPDTSFQMNIQFLVKGKMAADTNIEGRLISAYNDTKPAKVPAIKKSLRNKSVN